MKVLHLCQRDHPGADGALQVGASLVREQRKRGYDARVVFLYGKRGPICEEFGPVAMALELTSSRQAGRGILRLRQLIGRFRPALIHLHDGIIWPRFALIGMGMPVITHGHAPYTLPRWPKNMLAPALIRLTTDRVIVVSDETRKSWIDAGYAEEEVATVPNGVDLNRFQPVTCSEKCDIRVALHVPENKRVLVWVGRLHKTTKGTDRVARIASVLPDDVVLAIVGNGPDRGELEGACTEQIRNGRVRVVGAVAEVERWYQAADAHLFTSWHEAFGLVLVEAAATGLRTLAFPVRGGANELLTALGALCVDDSSDDGELRAAVESVLTPERSDELRRTAVSRYSSEASAQRTLLEYEKALAAGSPR